MAIILKNTNDVVNNGLRVLVYGQAGAGKTTLTKTLPSPVIISTEAGLLSLRSEKIPYIEVASVAALGDVFKWLTESAESKAYKSVVLDSLSEIAEVVLSGEKKNNKDGRAAYGEMNDVMSQIIRSFRDLPERHVYFTAKAEKTQTDTGELLWSPSAPGKSLTQSLPYYFDEVLALRLIRDEKGEIRRVLQCHSDLSWLAKDRSGRLAPIEAADLGAIIKKIGGGKDGNK